MKAFFSSINRPDPEGDCIAVERVVFKRQGLGVPLHPRYTSRVAFNIIALEDPNVTTRFVQIY